MRDLVTTVLELAGVLMLIVSATLFVWTYSVPAAFATAGGLLLGASALIVATAPKPRPAGQETV